MTDIPNRRDANEKVFVSVYRDSALRMFLIKVLLPAAGVLCWVGFLSTLIPLYLSVGKQSLPEERTQVLLMFGGLLLMGFSTGTLFLVVSSYLKKRFHDTYIIANEKGIEWHRAGKTIQAEWKDVELGRVIEAGRLQTAQVKTPQGNFTFDATFADAHGPRLVVKLGMKGEYLLYPDTSTRPITISRCELYHVVREWAGKK